MSALAKLRSRFIASPAADLLADYVVLWTASLPSPASDPAEPLPDSGDPDDATVHFLTVCPAKESRPGVRALIDQRTLEAAEALDKDLLPVAKGALLAAWETSGEEPLQRLTAMAKRVDRRQLWWARAGRAVLNKRVSWEVFKWAVAGSAAFLASQIVSRPDVVITSAAPLEAWPREAGAIHDGQKLIDAIGSLWASKMANETLATLPEWCRAELPSGDPSPPCASLTLTRLAQITGCEKGELSRSQEIEKAIDSWPSPWGPVKEGSRAGPFAIRKARTLFEPDFVTSHLWGQPSGVFEGTSENLGYRRKRAIAALAEYEGLLTFVDEQACAAAVELKKIVDGTHATSGAPNTCVLLIHLRNQGSANAWIESTKITLGDVKAEVVDLDDRTSAEATSATTGSLLIPPLGDVALHVRATKGCELGQGTILIPYEGTFKWSAAKKDASTLKIPKSAWASPKVCSAP